MRDGLKELFSNKKMLIMTILVFGFAYSMSYLISSDTREWQIANGIPPTTLDLPFWAQITIFYTMDFIITTACAILLWCMAFCAIEMEPFQF